MHVGPNGFAEDLLRDALSPRILLQFCSGVVSPEAILRPVAVLQESATSDSQLGDRLVSLGFFNRNDLVGPIEALHQLLGGGEWDVL